MGFKKEDGEKNNSLSKEMLSYVNSKICFEANNKLIVAKELCNQKTNLYLRTALDYWKQNLM